MQKYKNNRLITICPLGSVVENDVFMKIKRYSVADRVAEQLRMLIIRGKLVPGQKVTEDEFSREFDVSRTPLREAFRILQAEGFLSYKTGCGVTVSKYSMADIEQLWELRSVLESEAAARVAKCAENKPVDKLWEMCDEELYIANYDNAVFSENDSDFHQTIAGNCGNRFMAEEITTLWRKSALPRRIILFDEVSAKMSNDEHKVIVRMIERSDPDGAFQAMKTHMENSYTRISIKYEKANQQEENA